MAPQPAQRPGQRLITLTTCSEIFHTDNRMIAFGHLVEGHAPKAAGSLTRMAADRPIASPATSTPAAG